MSVALDSSDDFDRAELFDIAGVTFPLRAGEGGELGVIFAANGQPLLTVDSDGELTEAAVRARVLLLMTTLNAIVEEWEDPAFRPPSEGQEPAVPIRRSVTPDYLVCLEDGRKFKSLKRHLRVKYNLSPDEYRARWGLPADYPMVAPNYAKARYQLAAQIGRAIEHKADD